MRKTIFRPVMLAAVTTLLAANTAQAQQPLQLQTRAEGYSATKEPLNDCTKLAGLSGPIAKKFAEMANGPVTIVSASIVPAGGDGKVGKDDLPEYCRIVGHIPPNVGFLLRMPTKGWNGKFMMGGCGGPCGNFLEDRIDPALVRNYATVTTDMGHKGVGWSFGYENFLGMADFGFRATHITADVAKKIVAEFYGRKASRNYYFGCSTGGRQGMVEAQRFAWDFDGIVAGALPWTQTGYDMINANWPGKVNTRTDGSLTLSPAKLPMIHKAVMAKCDARDGWKDGILQNPLACDFKAAELLCKPGQTAECLTKDEADVLQKIYDGPYTQPGAPRYFLGQGGLALGSELKWRNLGPSQGATNSMAKYFNVFSPRGPDHDDRTDEILPTMADLNMTEWMFSAMNPDLRNFKAAGGKLILFHGWDDGVPVHPSIEYYETASRLIGSEAATKDFFRLYLAGGMDHCRGGEGGGEVDWITALENWVEKDQAPEKLIAYHFTDYRTSPREASDYGAPYLRTARHPLKPSEYDRAHPIYPYPDWPVYSGKGDPKDPDMWVKAKKPVRLTL